MPLLRFQVERSVPEGTSREQVEAWVTDIAPIIGEFIAAQLGDFVVKGLGKGIVVREDSEPISIGGLEYRLAGKAAPAAPEAPEGGQTGDPGGSPRVQG